MREREGGLYGGQSVGENFGKYENIVVKNPFYLC